MTLSADCGVSDHLHAKEQSALSFVAVLLWGNTVKSFSSAGGDCGEKLMAEPLRAATHSLQPSSPLLYPTAVFCIKVIKL